MQTAAPWLVLLAFCALTWWVTPRRVVAAQFFDGRQNDGRPPGVLMVAISAAVTWVFAKPIANASDLAYAYGLTGGIGYTVCYPSFVVAGFAIYLLRTRGEYRSLPHFLVSKYGFSAVKLFMLLVLAVLFPGLKAKGLPEVSQATRDGGLTFCLLASVLSGSFIFLFSLIGLYSLSFAR